MVFKKNKRKSEWYSKDSLLKGLFFNIFLFIKTIKFYFQSLTKLTYKDFKALLSRYSVSKFIFRWFQNSFFGFHNSIPITIFNTFSNSKSKQKHRRFKELFNKNIL